MEYHFKNMNFKKYEAYGPEIDGLIAAINSSLGEFENSPKGEPQVVLHFLRAIRGKVMYLPLL